MANFTLFSLLNAVNQSLMENENEIMFFCFFFNGANGNTTILFAVVSRSPHFTSHVKSVNSTTDALSPAHTSHFQIGVHNII